MLIRLKPVFSHTIWGGTKLRTEFGYEEPGDDIGECWGIAAHPHGDCIVLNPEYHGVHLSELWKEHQELFGHFGGDKYPLMTKIIDAKTDLSIQVHPDDTYAAKNENGSLGKTECWYVLDAEEDASLVVGHNAKDKDELVDMIDHGRWNEFLRQVPIKKNDFIQIDPGTVHAIKGGIVVLEPQQNSDITYRVYDYDRLQNGKPRELHIEKSKDVITVPAKSVEDSIYHDVDTEGCMELIASKYYKVWRLNIKHTYEWNVHANPFTQISVVEGTGTIHGEEVKKGDHFIMSANEDMVVFQGDMKVIASTPCK